MKKEVWHATAFTKNRDRLLAGEVAREIPGGSKRVTLAADQGYDTREFVERLHEPNA